MGSLESGRNSYTVADNGALAPGGCVRPRAVVLLAWHAAKRHPGVFVISRQSPGRSREWSYKSRRHREVTGCFPSWAGREPGDLYDHPAGGRQERRSQPTGPRVLLRESQGDGCRACCSSRLVKTDKAAWRYCHPVRVTSSWVQYRKRRSGGTGHDVELCAVPRRDADCVL